MYFILLYRSGLHGRSFWLVLVDFQISNWPYCKTVLRSWKSTKERENDHKNELYFWYIKGLKSKFQIKHVVAYIVLFLLYLILIFISTIFKLFCCYFTFFILLPSPRETYHNVWFDLITTDIHTAIPGLWTQESDAGLWTLVSGLWTMDDGRWTVDIGLWTLDSERWTLEARLWTLGSGLWTLDSGHWTLDTGLWTLGSGLWTLDSGCWTLGAGLWTLDSGLWTLDAGLWTLDTTILDKISVDFLTF